MIVDFWKKVLKEKPYDVGRASDLVEPLGACPNCLENRKDFLVWTEDGAGVICQSCGKEYTPGYTGHR